MTERVMVFAPAPILTVTIEQQSAGSELHVHPGGRGGRAEAVRELRDRVRLEDRE